MGGTLDLVVIVVQAGDVSAGELGNLTSGTANTAADIKNLHILSDANAVGKVVLVAGNGLIERLAGREAAEVERLAPAIFVQVGRQVIVAVERRNVSRQATCGM